MIRIWNERTLLSACIVLVSAVSLAAADAEPRAVEAKAEPVAAQAPTADATPTTRLTATPTPALKPTEAFKPLAVIVNLQNGEELNGSLVQIAELPMRTSFGEVNIPTSEVAGIRLARDGSVTTTVVMHNGDSVTGAITLETVNIETEWGKAEVNGASITSILFTPGVKWVLESGLNGTRWKITAIDPPAKATPTVAPASATTAVVVGAASRTAQSGVRAAPAPVRPGR